MDTSQPTPALISSRQPGLPALTPRLRKLALTAHVATSVGWLGAVAGFLALSIAGVTSRNADTVRGAYLAMNLIGQAVIVPLSLASLLTGLIQSLGTQWGLFRYYWVAVKFALTLGATVLLMLHQFTAVAEGARRAAAAPSGTIPDVGRFGGQLVGDAGLALLVLLVTTVLSVYKPWGKISYARTSKPISESIAPFGRSPTTKVVAVIALIVVAFIVLHLSCGPHGMHGM